MMQDIVFIKRLLLEHTSIPRKTYENVISDICMLLLWFAWRSVTQSIW